jgi:hypothetical protein
LGRFLSKGISVKPLFGPCTPERDEFFIFIESHRVEECFYILNKFDADIFSEHITESLLTGKYYNRVFDYVFSQEENRSLLETFRRTNLTKDMVLELIFEKGIANMTELERSILNSDGN